jgi:hypothetical protein
MADRLRAGEREARSGLPHGPDEVGRLAAALDQSAAAIADRETRLDYANRALRVLSAGNRTLLDWHDEASLLDQMCRAIVEAGGFRLAWIGYAEAEGRIRLMASSGTQAGLLDGLQVSWDHADEGAAPWAGPSARAGCRSGPPRAPAPTTPSGRGTRWRAAARPPSPCRCCWTSG